MTMFAASSLAQDSLCDPCVDPPLDRQLVPEFPPLRTRSDIPRDPIPFVTADQLRRMAPEDAVRRLLTVLEAQGETEMATQLRNTPPEDAIRGLLANWAAQADQQDADAAAGDDEADDLEPANE